MDLSINYINMCQKAIEIQNLWEPRGGDFYLHDYRGFTGTGVDFEKQAWGDKDETWNKVEILCYQPADAKQFWISTEGKKSIILSAKDLVKEHSKWLPRQDQLQEMMSNSSDSYVAAIVDNLFAFTMGVSDSDNYIPETMEQLWLVYIMSERYDKIWNGADWDVETNNDGEESSLKNARKGVKIK
jgi:hypothetical protein